MTLVHWISANNDALPAFYSNSNQEANMSAEMMEIKVIRKERALRGRWKKLGNCVDIRVPRVTKDLTRENAKSLANLE